MKDTAVSGAATGVVTGEVTVCMRNEQGRITEERQVFGVVTREGSTVIREAAEKPPNWYILTGTEDRIRYRGKTEPGRVQALDRGYPEASEDGGIIYRATFKADALNARGMNAAVLISRTAASAQNIAYARINPALAVPPGGTVQIQWEIRVEEKEQEQIAMSN
jgi:hypothetical protein